MATWSSLARFAGYRTSPNFFVNLDGSGAISRITWSSTEPQGTTLKIETNISFDGGYNWEGWKQAINGGAFPDVYSNTPLQNALIKYRVFQETHEKSITPILNDVSFYFEPIIEINNRGDVDLKPEIWITKTGNGDFSIINTSNGDQVFQFINLIDQETVYVDNEQEQIETSLPVTYRYKDFNDNYLTLPYGVNVLRVQGNAKIQFRHQFKLLQG